jgi:hypothetical protein
MDILIKRVINVHNNKTDEDKNYLKSNLHCFFNTFSPEFYLNLICLSDINGKLHKNIKFNKKILL